MLLFMVTCHLLGTPVCIYVCVRLYACQPIVAVYVDM